MTNNVHILAAVLNPKLIASTTLIFRTLRIGFPTANVLVWGNGLDSASEKVVAAAANSAGAMFKPIDRISHDAWIEQLIYAAEQPFWVCDTDLVFFDNMEADKSGLFAGRYEPEFVEEWTRCVKPARIHPCCMWINASALRQAIRAFMCQIPRPWRDTANFPLIRQTFVPRAGKLPLFFDTCAGLFSAVGGTTFTDQQNDCFEHLHCGTYADLVSPHLSVENLLASHAAICANPMLARGIRKKQDEYYASRKPNDEESYGFV